MSTASHTAAGDPLAGVEAARAHVAGQVERARQRRAALDTMAGQLADMTVTERSTRGEVTVTAKPGGRVVAVEIAEGAQRLAAASLSAIVTQTIAAAQHRAAQQAVRASAATLGEHAPLVDKLRADADRVFPDPTDGTLGYR